MMAAWASAAKQVPAEQTPLTTPSSNMAVAGVTATEHVSSDQMRRRPGSRKPSNSGFHCLKAHLLSKNRRGLTPGHGGREASAAVKHIPS